MLRVLLALPLFALVGCVGPTREPIPLTPENAAGSKRLVLEQTYIAGVMAAEYLLPYGPYHAEGSDKRGVYYRAPIPIKRRGLFGGALPPGESVVEGGIYLPNPSFLLLVWLYIYDEQGRIEATTLPQTFIMSEGRLWHLEPAAP